MKTILFDLDGTLLDTAPTFSYIINHKLSSRPKLPISDTQMRYRVSKGSKYMVHSAFQDQHNESEIEQLLIEFREVYQNHLTYLTKPLPGVIDLISELDNQNIPWGIITNKTSTFTIPLLASFPFDKAKIVVCSDTTGAFKPDPKPLIYACEQLQCLPETCIYVGDAITDIEVGNKVGMKTIAANFGYIEPSINILTWEADYIVNQPQKILDIASMSNCT